MDEIERRGLLKLLVPTPAPLKILLVESLSYVVELRSMMPNSDISVLTSDRYTQIEFGDLDFEWFVDDFNCAKLPFDDKTFDLIIAEDFFTFAHEPYDTLRDFGRLINELGSLITQYQNIRYADVLEQLRAGFFPERRRRLYAKPEVVRLLNDALFKDIRFVPESIADVDIDEWLGFGFDNFSDDLRVKTWLIKAGRSKAEVAALKQLFTAEVRAELARLIHRIEYDIDRKENFERLFELCEREMIFDDYLADFIHSTTAHHECFALFQSEAEKRGIELDFGD
mgnify:CR=1 FL=1